ncbi:transglutaminase superfamily protein [Flavobacterium sp. 90]|uniref:transglutaminase-like domain-containing protein n=1 Tax=unclassified Flavobacterium TaxID=196869 RepID=UPI000EAE5198|nr:MULTISPECIES: transglutaminase-like domain-containing protein [unclassified Flavobacterium]RKR10052.1 transglutaminase superfamily protein [Flavobacterium sp. 81]TCK53837.1 transglutaminase superfamily protein [Flavobacterium sp. 90]
MIKIFTYCFLLVSQTLLSQSISLFDANKNNLEKIVLDHYKSDPEKTKAAQFLISNMDIHYSENYKWVDKNDKKISFNEFDYPNMEIAVKAFQKLQDSIKVSPKLYKTKDIDIVTPEFLIKNIDLAFSVWKNNLWSKSYDFKTFCEYILPYRSLTEPLEDWRENFAFLSSDAINTVINKQDPVDVATQTILTLKNFRFLNSRPDPISYLSPKQLLFRRQGDCGDLANLTLLACRSMGLAVTFDFTPYYAASSKRHFWDTIIDENGKHIPFNGNCFGNPQGLPNAYNATEKRLAKVFRKTYSVQQNTLAVLKDSLSIPEGFLREKNILDVTSEYVPVGKIIYPFPITNKETISFLNVFNLGKWKATDWGKKSGTNMEYLNLGTNIVYLPSLYKPDTKKMNYAPYPILLNIDKKQQVLRPDYSKTFSYNITRDKTKKAPNLDFNSFEVFENEVFNLYVWDNGWRKIEEAKAQSDFIRFSKIPDNGLFWVLCSKSNGYERIFVINSHTKQIEWY